jgi:hypothetical protein
VGLYPLIGLLSVDAKAVLLRALRQAQDGALRLAFLHWFDITRFCPLKNQVFRTPKSGFP